MESGGNGLGKVVRRRWAGGMHQEGVALSSVGGREGHGLPDGNVCLQQKKKTGWRVICYGSFVLATTGSPLAIIYSVGRNNIARQDGWVWVFWRSGLGVSGLIDVC